LDSTASTSNASRLFAQDRGPAEAADAVVVAKYQYRGPSFAALISTVVSDTATPSSLDVRQIADPRRTIRAFGVGLAAKRNRIALK
jgi:hypothetical protein